MPVTSINFKRFVSTCCQAATHTKLLPRWWWGSSPKGSGLASYPRWPLWWPMSSCAQVRAGMMGVCGYVVLPVKSYYTSKLLWVTILLLLISHSRLSIFSMLFCACLTHLLVILNVLTFKVNIWKATTLSFPLNIPLNMYTNSFLYCLYCIMQPLEVVADRRPFFCLILFLQILSFCSHFIANYLFW